MVAPAQTSSAHAFCDSLYDVEIRTVLCSTNAIESLNARYRRAITVRGHFPTEQAGRIQAVSATPGGVDSS